MDEYIYKLDSNNLDCFIDLNDNKVKTYIIEEERNDIRVYYSGDIESDLVINQSVENNLCSIKIASKYDRNEIIRSISSVLNIDSKLYIFLPREFVNYKISSNICDIRINNVSVSKMEVNNQQGSINVKYCDVESLLNINTTSASISIKDVEVNGRIDIANDKGYTKIKDMVIDGQVNVVSNSGSVYFKNLKVLNDININTHSSNVDFDDVYAAKVAINADTSLVNYFNGNFIKEFEVIFNVKNGEVRTNLLREKK